MIETEKKIMYKAFGLRIISEIALPELLQMSPHIDAAEVEIVRNDLPAVRAKLEGIPNQYVIIDNQVMFYIPNNAFYCIHDGKSISVSPVHGADEDLIRLYILGTCMAALLMQRSIYPLHGSAVAINGKAYAIVGESGAGKSTLASAFISQGYPLLSDDLIAVSLSQEDQSVLVTPSFPQQKLWQESIQQFGMTTSNYRSVYGRETKFSIPVISNYFPDPLPLAGVIELVKEENTKVDILRIERLDRFQTLFTHTFRQFLVPSLGLMEWHFNTSAAIVNQISMYQLRRPESGFTAHQLVSLLLNTLQMEENR
ncbi:aldolase [Paenibacillus eucommiae]|uniref:Energy-coupling factor transporter ATP-binding protein EcfA2 n=1 Tax=Paenibacillus eucommiae TaxID=1355755 RepID=A0ABS4IS31_9BACL|nr:aldolase [Paenibacillus eucommiae]MBP1990384.1 energy-coupling factor transporter ATP-binding protein EcfA2 [Paenibacillus eucommiae]